MFPRATNTMINKVKSIVKTEFIIFLFFSLAVAKLIIIVSTLLIKSKYNGEKNKLIIEYKMAVKEIGVKIK